MCNRKLVDKSYTAEQMLRGEHLRAYKFEEGTVWMYDVMRNFSPPSKFYKSSASLYTSSVRTIFWSGVMLDRQTLELKVGWEDNDFQDFTISHCELIDPDKIEPYFPPYIDQQKVLYKKEREGNRL